jgi:hypothetical protein
MSSSNRIVMAVIAVAILVGGFLVLKPGDDNSKDKSPQTKASVVVVQGAKPVGGVQRLTYNKGDTVDLTVRSDTADEIHIHGYDLMKDVEKGGAVHFKFRATIDGTFEIELEGHKQQIAALEVAP